MPIRSTMCYAVGQRYMIVSRGAEGYHAEEQAWKRSAATGVRPEMAIAELPVVANNTRLAEAFEKMRQADRSGLVVLYEDGARLYRVDLLEVQLPDRGDRPMSQIRGGQWIPRQSDRSGQDPEEVAPEAILLNVEGPTATIDFHSEEMARELRLAMRIYRCNVDQNHSYTALQVKSLRKVRGGWACRQADNGIVS